MIIFFRPLMRYEHCPGRRLDTVKHDRPTSQLWLYSATVAFGLVGTMSPAHSECLSPSADSGATATTVYRCPDQQGSGAPQQPAVNNLEKTTVVERGSADAPWFEPKPVDNSVSPAASPAQPVQTEQSTEEKPPQAEQKVVEQPGKKPSAKTKSVRKKLVKLKPAKTKTARALTTKARPVKNPSDAKASPKKPDENTVVWTRKDVPLGNRIVNWFGL